MAWNSKPACSGGVLFWSFYAFILLFICKEGRFSKVEFGTVASWLQGQQLSQFAAQEVQKHTFYPPKDLLVEWQTIEPKPKPNQDDVREKQAHWGILWWILSKAAKLCLRSAATLSALSKTAQASFSQRSCQAYNLPQEYKEPIDYSSMTSPRSMVLVKSLLLGVLFSSFEERFWI